VVLTPLAPHRAAETSRRLYALSTACVPTAGADGGADADSAPLGGACVGRPAAAARPRRHRRLAGALAAGCGSAARQVCFFILMSIRPAASSVIINPHFQSGLLLPPEASRATGRRTRRCSAPGAQASQDLYTISYDSPARCTEKPASLHAAKERPASCIRHASNAS